MLAVLIDWIILLAVFCGLGDAFLQVYNKVLKQGNQLSLVNTFFVGLAIGGILACSISIFFPLTAALFIGIFAVVFIYLALCWRRIQSAIIYNIKRWKDLPIWGKVFLLFISFVVLYHSSSVSSSFDQFLYHQQHIKWLQEYGVVKGLANLHLRFGFNSSSLSLASLFAYHPSLKISFTALNGLCILVLSMWLSLRMLRSGNAIHQLIYAICLVIFAHFYAMEQSSTSTDIIVNVLLIYLLLNCFLKKEAQNFIIPLAILPVFCVTLKLSSAPIVILTLYSYYHLIKEKKKKDFLVLLGLGTLIAIPWLTQNILLTGYLVFPFPEIDLFSFDWKVPVDIVAAEKTNTYIWAKGGEASASALGWIPAWYLHLPLMDKAIYSFALLAIPVFVVMSIKKKKEKIVLIACLTAIVGSVFGLLTAPSLRFSLGFVLATAFISILFLPEIKSGRVKKLIRAPQYIFLVLFVIFHVDYIGAKTIEKMKMGKEYMRAQYIKPFPFAYMKGDTKYKTIEVDGVSIYVPVDGQCYDHELPCTVDVHSNLQLRNAGSMGGGFRIKQD